jgi:hypothetical protein
VLKLVPAVVVPALPEFVFVVLLLPVTVDVALVVLLTTTPEL